MAIRQRLASQTTPSAHKPDPLGLICPIGEWQLPELGRIRAAIRGLPHLKKAELIQGVVYKPLPVYFSKS
jgi:hypothetical protein